MSRGRSFPPVVDDQTRVLILGSLPGVKSLQAQQYYAHPQNGFWRLVGGLINVDLIDLVYADRLTTLRAHGIGLWDVIDEATRAGSLDAAIRDHRVNDLMRLLERLPALRAIAFNGQTSAKLGRRALVDVQDITLINLPSSSPALTTPLAVKADAWGVLRAHLT